MALLLSSTLPGIIRSIKSTTNNELLCLEFVVPGDGVPHYQIIDLEKKEILQEKLSIKPSKTLVLKAITSDRLLLNEYSDGKNPDHAAAISFDFYRREIAWEKADFQVLEVVGNHLKAPHPHFENRFSYWDIKNGVVVDDEKKVTGVLNKKESFPFFYPENSKHFKWFEQHIANLTGHEARICCEYMELDAALVISYYYMEGKGLTNELLILNRKGEIKEQINLGKNLQGIGKDTFFALENKIICITHKTTLNIYEV